MKLLTPDMIKVLGRLEFMARKPKTGFLSGRHKSPHKGFSSEFVEHRQYVRGDDLRLADWRIYARTDKYYVKEFTEETNLSATILLDCSASMSYAGDQAMHMDGAPLSKLDYARRLAAMFSYLLIHQQDAVGLVTFDHDIKHYIPARSQPLQLRRLLEHVSGLEAGGETDMAPIFHTIAERIPRRGLVVVISDLFDDPAALTKAFHHFHYRGHELVIFHTMAPEEISFPMSGFLDFHDLEGIVDALPLNPASLRSQYLEEVTSFVDTIEKECGRLKAEYMPVNTGHDFKEVFAQYVKRRIRGK